jgi:hypothetical protein
VVFKNTNWCTTGDIANIILWKFWLNKILINKNVEMCNKNFSLQVGEKWKFTLAKTSEMYKTKSKEWLWNLYPT